MWLKIAADELAMGVKVEAEHLGTWEKIQSGTITTPEQFKESIANDHLSEIKNYYTLLNKMEADAKQSTEVK
jgi:hypothetical protein